MFSEKVIRPSHQWLLLALSVGLTVAVVLSMALTGKADATKKRSIVVPRDYPTIQAAVNAASPRSTINVSQGTYTEQISIDKDLKLTGSGAGSTIIRAPETLVPGKGTPGTPDENAIVEIQDEASLALSQLTVSGPGAGTCEDGALRNGILVLPDSHLDLSFAGVTHIHDTPVSNCSRSGNAILAEDASVNIRNTSVSDYQAAAIVIVGGTATITDNTVSGPGASTATTTGGIELVAGATGTVSGNTVSGNACGNPDFGCGPDFFNEFQQAGIVGGEGTVITQNTLYDNQVGIYGVDSAMISRNVLTNNHYFGIALQDGSFTVSNDQITGGEGGVAVIAASHNTEAVLDRVSIAQTAGAPVQKFECCGYNATATVKDKPGRH